MVDRFTLQCKVNAMQSDRAREHLEVIRTLMERSAVYRRALAPMSLLAGAVGLLGAGAGWALDLSAPRAFVGYWLAVGVATGVVALLLTRQQALKAKEPFWSPPTRRVVQAAGPALLAGLVLGMVIWWRVGPGQGSSPPADALAIGWLPCGWVILYGCAVHSAGFFMPRGIRLFGGILVFLGCLLLVFGPPQPTARFGWAVMGGVFGALHLAYGIYLRFTEPRDSVA
jgi:hypothetical protein